MVYMKDPNTQRGPFRRQAGPFTPHRQGEAASLNLFLASCTCWKARLDGDAGFRLGTSSSPRLTDRQSLETHPGPRSSDAAWAWLDLYRCARSSFILSHHGARRCPDPPEKKSRPGHTVQLARQRHHSRETASHRLVTWRLGRQQDAPSSSRCAHPTRPTGPCWMPEHARLLRGLPSQPWGVASDATAHTVRPYRCGYLHPRAAIKMESRIEVVKSRYTCTQHRPDHSQDPHGAATFRPSLLARPTVCRQMPWAWPRST